MPWSLVTAPDELERCCFVQDGERCEQPTTWRLSGAALDDYAYVCGDHAALVRQPGEVAERV